MTTRRCWRTVLTLGALLAPGMTGAQPLEAILRGRVVLIDSVTPATGAVIEAVLSSDPTVRSRTLAGVKGDFTLLLARGGTWRVSAMRIGFVPTPLGAFEIADREQRRVDAPFVVSGAAVGRMIARLVVDTGQVCGRGPEDSGLLVATLLGQARGALAATVLSAADGGATAEWQRFAMLTDRLGTPLTPMRLERFTSATDRPFRSESQEALAKDGYYWDRGDERQYNAPDAQVLLSEQFVSSHCYRLSGPHPERSEWVGVTFTPAERRRGIVEVRGTIWLDRASVELRQLDYEYVDLPPALERAGARGAVEFLRLPTDVWVVSRWEMRLPRQGIVRSRTGDVDTEPSWQVNAVMISGGEVTLVRRDGADLLRNAASPVDRFPEVTARIGMAPQCPDAPQAVPGDDGVVYGSVVDTLGRPLRASARLTWTSVRRSRSTNFFEERNVSATDGLFIFCGVSLGARLTVQGFIDGKPATAKVTVRLQNLKPWTSVNLIAK